MLFVIAAVITTNFQADFVILTCDFYMVLNIIQSYFVLLSMIAGQ